MDRLYTPWRMKYITSDKKKSEGCIFCAKFNEDVESDSENYIVYRGETTFTIMNIYPYNTGHLMILPQNHVAGLTDISAQTQYEMMALAAYFTDLLTDLMRPDGFNVGINLGGAAGAGIDTHLHLHIVPRWSGDSNFMSVIGDTRVLPEELSDTYQRLTHMIQKKPPKLSSV